MRILSAHQPNFLPWAGYFIKIIQSDFFVFSDDVQYSKQQLVNRAKFKSREDNEINLVLPVMKNQKHRICDKYISKKDLRVFHKSLNKIKVEYSSYEHYSDMVRVIDVVENAVRNNETLSQLNIFLIKNLCQLLEIKLNYKLGSDLGLDAYKANERLLYRSQILGVNGYLCGRGASAYQDDLFLTKNGMKISYVDYDSLSWFGDDAAYSILHLIGKYGLISLKKFFREAKLNVS